MDTLLFVDGRIDLQLGDAYCPPGGSGMCVNSTGLWARKNLGEWRKVVNFRSLHKAKLKINSINNVNEAWKLLMDT